jgi:hypothetical protein
MCLAGRPRSLLQRSPTMVGLTLLHAFTNNQLLLLEAFQG